MSMISTVSFVYHNMKSWTLFLQLVLISMATADGPKERFLVTLSTSIVNTVTTVNYTTTPTTYCLTNTVNITACRKRRGIEEDNFIAKRDADSIFPTETFAQVYI
jgi:hypothetical protein